MSDLRDALELLQGHSATGSFGLRSISDLPAGFVADPFIISDNGRWYLFAEVWDLQAARGVIGVAVSEDAIDWEWGGVVLAEQYHLSYPHVFTCGGRFYMVPETWEAGCISIYTTDALPHGWKRIASLTFAPVPKDATFFEHAGRWWCMVETSPSHQHDTLRLYSASSFSLESSDWKEHPASPIVAGDPSRARPAGPPVVIDGALHRLSQDCSLSYGRAVRAHRILSLSLTTYEEDARGEVLLFASGRGWNRNGMHHLSTYPDDESGLTVVAADGW